MRNTNLLKNKKRSKVLKDSLIPFFLFLFCSMQAQNNYEPGKLRLKLTEEMAAEFEDVSRSQKTINAKSLHSIQFTELESQYDTSDYKRVFPNAGKHEEKHRKYGLHLWYEVDVDASMDLMKIAEGYTNTLGVQKAEPVYIPENIDAKQDVNIVPVPKLNGSSNDPLFDDQWGYDNNGQTGGKSGADISLLEAWDIQTGNSDVIVAISDSGIDADHQDLAQNMWVNTGEIPNNGIDDDNNGYIDDIHGYGFGDSTSEIIVGSHGTHVAGIVAAVSNNNVGVAGIAGGDGSGNGVKLMSCAVYGNGATPDGFATSFVYAADNGAVIAQCSWGYAGDFYPDFVEEAIDYFIAEAGYDDEGNARGPMQGGLVVFSAGNLGSFDVQFPAADPVVMAIANTDHNDEAFIGSNRGDWIDLAAPGTAILSTFPDNTYGTQTGTSFSCPQVSGVAALIVSEFAGNITPEEVRARIVDNADPLGVSYLGSGRLNAYAALQGGTTLSTETLEANTSLKPILLPNPVQNEFTLFNLKEVKKVMITDILGKTIIKEEVNAENENKVFNLSSLKSGMYIINYYDKNGGVTSSKFIKE